jgi:hypothetical protein
VYTDAERERDRARMGAYTRALRTVAAAHPDEFTDAYGAELIAAGLDSHPVAREWVNRHEEVSA